MFYLPILTNSRLQNEANFFSFYTLQRAGKDEHWVS